MSEDFPCSEARKITLLRALEVYFWVGVVGEIQPLP